MPASSVLLLNLSIKEGRPQHVFFYCCIFSIFVKGKMETKYLIKYLTTFKHFTKLFFLAQTISIAYSE